MSNEVVKNEEVEVVEVVDNKEVKPDYNLKAGDKVIGLQIKCKRVKNDDVDFNSVKGLLYLPVFELNKKGDLVNRGKKNRWLDVHFKKVAFKGVPNECEVHSPEDLTTGTLYVKLKGIQTPSKYVITKDEDGNDVYPEIWVRSDIMGFIPYTPDEDVFKYHDTSRELDFEDDEDEDTESAELSSDDVEANN